jgi:predicted metal-dependent hydrolase
MDSHEKGRLYHRGLEAFNSSEFFDAHELWEDVWRETPGPDKRYLQGLIQIAAAFHHYSRANLRGTRKLLEEGLLKLDTFPPSHRGLEIEPLRAAVREWLAALASGRIPDGLSPPQIARSKAHGHSAHLTLRDDGTGGEKT